MGSKNKRKRPEFLTDEIIQVSLLNNSRTIEIIDDVYEFASSAIIKEPGNLFDTIESEAKTYFGLGKVDLKRRLELIIDYYINEKNNEGFTRWVDVKSELEKIHLSSNRTLKNLQKLPIMAVYDLIAKSTPEWKEQDIDGLVQSYILTTQRLSLVCKDLSTTVNVRGKRKYLRKACYKLMDLWALYVGSEMPITLDTNIPDKPSNGYVFGDEEFVRSGPNFVLSIIKKIDPQVTLSQVRTGISEPIK